MTKEYAQEVPFSYGVAFVDADPALNAVVTETDPRHVA
jgi:hypothetical protein